MISFKESDSVSLMVKIENTGVISEPAYATQISVVFDKRLDFMKKDDIVNILIFINSLLNKLFKFSTISL